MHAQAVYLLNAGCYPSTQRGRLLRKGKRFIPDRKMMSCEDMQILNEHVVFKQLKAIRCYEIMVCRGTGKANSRWQNWKSPKPLSMMQTAEIRLYTPWAMQIYGRILAKD